MELLHQPIPLVLYLTALFLTLFGGFLHRRMLQYLGGFLWTAGTIFALLFGVPRSEVLLVTLTLLLCAMPGGRRNEL